MVCELFLTATVIIYFLLKVSYPVLQLTSNLLLCRQWAGSSLVSVRWERGAALMSSTGWRRGCCLLSHSRYRPSRRHSRSTNMQPQVWELYILFTFTRICLWKWNDPRSAQPALDVHRQEPAFFSCMISWIATNSCNFFPANSMQLINNMYICCVHR